MYRSENPLVLAAQAEVHALEPRIKRAKADLDALVAEKARVLAPLDRKEPHRSLLEVFAANASRALDADLLDAARLLDDSYSAEKRTPGALAVLQEGGWEVSKCSRDTWYTGRGLKDRNKPTTQRGWTLYAVALLKADVTRGLVEKVLTFDIDPAFKDWLKTRPLLRRDHPYTEEWDSGGGQGPSTTTHHTSSLLYLTEDAHHFHGD
jgi:hypothetical protein